MGRIARAMCTTVLVISALSASAALAIAVPVSVKPGTADPTQFPQSLQCVCHGMLLRDWQASMHSKALDDPLFNAKVAEVIAATGGKFGAFCRRCHAPVANMTSQDDANAMSPAASQGIVCSYCHQVAGMTKHVANVPHLLELTGVMRAQLEDAESPHFTQYSPLHTTSKICGGCHNVDHPGNGLHLATTYTEWQRSPQARKGIQCQDCHMSESPPKVGPSAGFAAEAAPERPNIYRMTFAGAQVALGNALRARALLQSAAKLQIEAPEVISAGGPAMVSVRITNVGAGHYLPTGVTELRQMWLSVVAVDRGGNETEIGRRDFGTEFKDARGRHPVEIQDAVGIGKDDRIPPGATVTQAYKLALPAGVAAADVKARLFYKSVPDELATRAGVENPTTTMAEAATRVFATEEAKAVDTSATSPAAEGATVSAKPLLACAGLLILAGGLGVVIVVRARKASGP